MSFRKSYQKKSIRNLLKPIPIDHSLIFPHTKIPYRAQPVSNQTNQLEVENCSGLFDFCQTGLNLLGETGLNRQVSGETGRNWEKLKIGIFYKKYMFYWHNMVI